ncbi:sugar ABC transporter permease [Anaerotignum lactatifermentans]|uniref:Xylose transport system permease protein XylH n=1 Tax=Anaerotignum lactatifermentans TaxID=160404 RepID=A0ABS2GAG5_9FIRM|nr:multiple monosaccharide ABC transporter permease [Anaerotignum lactatifermentans]MBM6828440.1 sugar ABC transporter permease [Anaerotignum lactatifermentans]MBM6877720.1 sugar ABC transporter permease [Anaerotignum lactatifermentans]MBM6950023.1 sugar ABC transporter permease [Anaerotignum lactatifermentans]
MNKVKEAMKKNTMLFVLVIVTILFQVLITINGKGSMFAPTNVSNLIMQNSYVVIMATGMLLCILTGGNIDLSVGSIVALVGAVTGILIVNMHMNIYVAIILSLLVGLAIGIWQGFWIAYMNIPPFLVTLSGMLIWRGLATVLLNGTTISPFPDNYLKYFTSYIPSSGNVFVVSIVIGIVVCVIMFAVSLYSQAKKRKKGYETGNTTMLVIKLAIISVVILAVCYLLGKNKGIPVVLILLAVVVLIYNYLTTRTVPGRHLYALGGNAKATQLSGIDTRRIMFGAYVNMAFLAAVAALVCVARFNSAAPSAGTNYEMDAIGACFIGGASAYGGTGTVGGAVIGAIFMGILNNGMSILGIDANWQKMIKGLVLLFAVVFDVVSKKRSK